jgi:type I restriction enzyme S subunit
MKTLIKQIRGVSYKPDDLHDTLGENSIILLRANNIADGQINFDDVVYVDRRKVSKEQILRRGDILICASSGSKNLVGKAASVDFEQEATFGAFCKVVRPNCLDDAEYIAMYFQSPIYRREISAVAIGININNIRNEHIDSLSVNWPNSANRHQAVDVLVKIDSIIRHREAELRKLDDLIKARFVELFGNPVTNAKNWNTDSCKNLMSKIGSGATPKGGRESYCDEGISLIRSMNVYNNRFEYKDLAHITEEQAEQLDSVTIEKSDVLLNITGASVARCCVVPDNLLPARVNQHVSIIRCKENLLPEFVCSMFTEDNYQRLLWNIATAGGATREAITKQQIEDLVLIVPPINLQKQFVAFIKQVDKSKVAVQKALDEAQVLFDSLMQQYFG